MPAINSPVEQLIHDGQAVTFPAAVVGETTAQRASRTVSAAWLTDLFAGADFTCAVPISITNAVIHGPITLRGATFKHYVILRGCEFDSEVILNFARFERSLILDDSVFVGKARFRGASIDGDLSLAGCSFKSASNFADAHVTQLLMASGAEFMEANFERMHADKGAFFRVLRRSGNLIRTRFQRSARFLDAHIGGTADFNGVYFGAGADFTRVTIEGDAMFSVAYLDDDLVAITSDRWPAEFHGATVFDSLHVDGNALFHGAIFGAEASFRRASVGGNVDFEPSYRDDERHHTVFREKASFNQLRVGGHAWFDGVQFSGPASFESARFEGAVLFRVLEEEGTSKYVHGTVFHKDARFLGADMLTADFQGTQFLGQANFARIKIHADAQFNGWTTRTGDRLYRTALGPRTTFQGAEIGGTLYFHNLQCSGDIDFLGAAVGTVHFAEPGHRRNQAEFKGHVDLRGMTYAHISADWPMLFARMEPYDRQPYVEMEKYFRSAGDDGEAGRIYVDRRKRESADLRRKFRRMKSESISHWLGACLRLLPDLALDSFQRHVLRYGVRPLRLLVFSLVFLCLGWFVFSQSGAVVERSASSSAPAVQLDAWRALRYSLNLFVPGVDLPFSGDLTPAPQARAPVPYLDLTYEAYGTLHRLAGLVLLPLGLAALIGLLVPSRDRNLLE